MPKLVDRVYAGVARFKAKSAGQRDVDVAFVKATNRDEGPPKEKHVDLLLRTSASEVWGTQAYIVGRIERSLLSSKSCVVVAKTLVLLHKLLKEGGAMFRENFYKGFSHLFDHLSNFKDDKSRYTWQLSTFIRAYAAFLYQRCILYSSFPTTAEEAEEEFRVREASDGSALASEVPVVQKAIDLGLQVGTSTDVVAAISVGALQGYAQHLVLGDVLALSARMMRAVPALVETFFAKVRTPDFLPEAKELIIVYKECQSLIERMSDLDESKLGQWGGLSLRAPPNSVLETMQGEVEGAVSAVRRVPSIPKGVIDVTDQFKDLSANSSDPGIDSLNEFSTH